ncbi:regulatory LuxR family protein [Neolewinella xylanilytica]|uniref:Regulatory LuxR family protein n=1 Tax=Neolewinella xylanilytica TaxID=1514080 RepID=A0A2S6I3R3_9BACT|nr:LuxR C-terminal-related transcriptional regulator [Neolewinella xylanilytica]PPK85800.1 regulatory LuxR family protein [Neolewinella xylanilytica]
MHLNFSNPGGEDSNRDPYGGDQSRSVRDGDPGGLLDRSAAFVYSIDYRTRRFKYLSHGIQRMLGFGHDSWKRRGAEAIAAAIHPEDQALYRAIWQHIGDVLRESPAKQRTNVHFTYCLRLLTADGVPVHLGFQKTIIAVDAAGNPVADVVVVTDITPFLRPQSGFLHIGAVGMGSHQSYNVDLPATGETIPFSAREREVLQLVAQGMSSREIAGALFISRDTVSTHRKNMMKKAGVNRAIELIRYARAHGLLEERGLPSAVVVKKPEKEIADREEGSDGDQE